METARVSKVNKGFFSNPLPVYTMLGRMRMGAVSC